MTTCLPDGGDVGRVDQGGLERGEEGGAEAVAAGHQPDHLAAVGREPGDRDHDRRQHDDVCCTRTHNSITIKGGKKMFNNRTRNLTLQRLQRGCV